MKENNYLLQIWKLPYLVDFQEKCIFPFLVNFKTHPTNLDFSQENPPTKERWISN